MFSGNPTCILANSISMITICLLLSAAQAFSQSRLWNQPSVSTIAIRGRQTHLPMIKPSESGTRDNINGGSTTEPVNKKPDEKEFSTNTMCRVVASSDSKIPDEAADSILGTMGKERLLQHNINAIYQARLPTELEQLQRHALKPLNGTNELALPLLKQSLEDAGFELLNRRDLDLCEALNVGYLLRLSIVPDIAKLDPSTGLQYCHKSTSFQSDLMFDGRVLVFRRGYATEITRGRLLLPKLDYLQASLVQRSAGLITNRIGRIERNVVSNVSGKVRAFRKFLRSNVLIFVDEFVPSTRVAKYLRSRWGLEKCSEDDWECQDTLNEKKKTQQIFKLNRYGGKSLPQSIETSDPTDALNPFLICNVKTSTSGIQRALDRMRRKINFKNSDLSMDQDIDYSINQGSVGCLYDMEQHENAQIVNGKNGIDTSALENPQMELLQRVSVSNLVDFFSKGGRRRLFNSFTSESELVEPTYEEVIVVWRQLPKKKKIKPRYVLPEFVYDIAEIFEVEDRLPNRTEVEQEETEPEEMPLQIRAFVDVPMANLAAVLPKTKLVFRPADALVFDLVSVFSLGAVAGSLRFDSANLDFIAVVSVSLWLIRYVLRYSNKLARYELLVNRFLTSKISHRGGDALKYVRSEAACQRATRAAIMHTWLLTRQKELSQRFGGNIGPTSWTRQQLIDEGRVGINRLLQRNEGDNVESTMLDIDTNAALGDLEDLGLVSFNKYTETLTGLADEEVATQKLRIKWNQIFDETATTIAQRSPDQSYSTSRGVDTISF
eukprot:CAMPEP_0198305454 /NCGR_PEP_ID=MMETSP1449-20131203/57916_1 /TAXON_ID=420275 /ORGANISM="Attheya septentrionalis, Strain CCMP2084" /LENGTH=777 /DNA_ID=CAMNT_0044007987 /DNA_START=137 /DNA_END=2470 /DNA_ORIENTATION=+